MLAPANAGNAKIEDTYTIVPHGYPRHSGIGIRVYPTWPANRFQSSVQSDGIALVVDEGIPYSEGRKFPLRVVLISMMAVAAGACTLREKPGSVAPFVLFRRHEEQRAMPLDRATVWQLIVFVDVDDTVWIPVSDIPPPRIKSPKERRTWDPVREWRRAHIRVHASIDWRYIVELSW